MSSTLEAIRNFKYSKNKDGYQGATLYHGCEIAPWNHPKVMADYIMNVIQHTITFGCQFIAPMGRGKTTAATVIAHYIHKAKPEFLVVWGDADDFQHLKRFLAGLPKQPLIIIFDDITGALKQMANKDLEKNFEILTKIRWEIDPDNGKIPVVTFTTSHYSKNTEKEFRAVLGMSAYLDFGAEEYTNIDTILPKHSKGRPVLEFFSKYVDKMYSKHQFPVVLGNGKIIWHETDKPLRSFCSIMGKDAQIIVTTKDDVCNLCSKKKTKKYISGKEFFDKITHAWGKAGVQALKLALWRRGHYLAIGRDAATASDFIERKLFSTFTTDENELVEECFKYAHKKIPKRIYHKKDKEAELFEDFTNSATLIEDDDKSLISNDSVREDSLGETV